MKKGLWKIEEIDIDKEQVTAVVDNNGDFICYMQVGKEHIAKEIVKDHNSNV